MADPKEPLTDPLDRLCADPTCNHPARAHTDWWDASDDDAFCSCGMGCTSCDCGDLREPDLQLGGHWNPGICCGETPCRYPGGVRRG